MSESDRSNALIPHNDAYRYDPDLHYYCIAPAGQPHHAECADDGVVPATVVKSTCQNRSRTDPSSQSGRSNAMIPHNDAYQYDPDLRRYHTAPVGQLYHAECDYDGVVRATIVKSAGLSRSRSDPSGQLNERI